MVYVGIFRNRGQLLPGEDEALDYAITRLGLAPAEGWDRVDKPLFLRYFALADFLSGDWIAYPSWKEYEREQTERGDAAGNA
ncbi:MAG TPA: hypothetical protein H9694_08185 [Firmicutes bacterium]|nr:hypothetical protein [Bacillota bacterium]